MGSCAEICAVAVMTVLDLHLHVVSVTEAAKSGLPRLLRDVEAGEDVVVERHGKPVAAVVSMRHLEEIRRVGVDLRETVLLLSRAATDGGDVGGQRAPAGHAAPQPCGSGRRVGRRGQAGAPPVDPELRFPGQGSAVRSSA
jgi:prevent-host-death family protein